MNASEPTSAAESLSQLLRERTQDLHTEVEGLAYIKCFMKGGLDLETYTEQLESLYVIYDALEAGLEKKKDHPGIQPLYFPELFRKESLAKDIQFLGGTVPTGNGPAAAAAYRLRMQELTQTAPALLTAHAYVRYLGDLSGGQILKRVVARLFSLEGAGGLAFYDFPAIADHQVFKEDYRSRLNALTDDASEQNALIGEARRAFEMTGAVFAELEPALRMRLGDERFLSLTTGKGSNARG